ncbi:MAG: fosfomycin resistance glutathione transferase [Kangiellaceae bacterium]|nr:fosfomycin resistance glutathione transferase [Kangiellaceae bacterium]MCW8997917.1 fosfomycin resistance glutathione transferase [Kangiellaceae bacterium]MCW9015724.1 fosfomycin resistance glutathione transferase [Kangiellaceae bacterium]
MISSLNHITLAVSDIEKSLSFYTHVLGFKGEVKWKTGAYLSLGELWLCLSLDSVDSRNDYTHIAFSIKEENIESILLELEGHSIEQWKANSSEGESIYILDPDGHKLELSCGSLASRLASLKNTPYEGLEWLN